MVLPSPEETWRTAPAIPPLPGVPATGRARRLSSIGRGPGSPGVCGGAGATANCRGSFLLTRTALPHLERSGAAHVLTLSPPRNLDPVWTGRHLGHTIVTYGMNLFTLELAYGPADADLMTDVLDG